MSLSKTGHSVLQHFAVCCSVLRCVAVWRHLHGIFQNRSLCVAVCCSVLWCVAVCCGVLQCVAVCCDVLRCVEICMSLSETGHCVLQCFAVCCSVFRCVALCCDVLQCVVV